MPTLPLVRRPANQPARIDDLDVAGAIVGVRAAQFGVPVRGHREDLSLLVAIGRERHDLVQRERGAIIPGAIL